MTVTVSIRLIDAVETETRLGELAGILVDAVAHGASVNFLAGFSQADGEAFWRSQLAGIAAGEKRLFVAEAGGRLVGTVMLDTCASAECAASRRDRQDAGAFRLPPPGPRTAAAAGSRDDGAREGAELLLLDTESGSAGEMLYRDCGWTPFGSVPGHSLRPEGRPAKTVFFYKRLD